jgi:diguanylate cyclase (GGDEF)-like protein
VKKVLPIRSYLLIVIISIVLVVAIAIGLISLIELNRYINTSSKDHIDNVCKIEADKVDDMFIGIEKSVQIMHDFVLNSVESLGELEDDARRWEIIRAADTMFANVAQNTEGAASYYLRFAPEISDNTTGLIYAKEGGRGAFIKHEPADLSLYSEEDSDYVGWYWQPYRERRAVWLVPYDNKLVNFRMISYVKPIYLSGKFVGVVGMDFASIDIREMVDEIKIYDRGYAFLAHGDHIAYHKDLAQKDHIPDYSGEYTQSSRALRNGMSLVLLAHNNDIHKIRFTIQAEIVVAVLIIISLVSLLTVIVVKRFTHPIETLTGAVESVANGEYDVKLASARTKEVQVLSDAFLVMADKVRAHDMHQHRLAYRDPLTGLRNFTAYKECTTDIEDNIGTPGYEFGIAMMDINYLKDTNDMFGHETGNKLIITAARIISTVFKRSPVFRIGGDEFVVILTGEDYKNRGELIEKMNQMATSEYVQSGDRSVPIGIAYGVSVYNADEDKIVIDVFNRADAEMYKKKREMKAFTVI